MKVILLDWNSYGNKYIEKAFREMEFTVEKLPYDGKLHGKDAEQQENRLKELLYREKPDLVFGFNYIPAVSIICQEYLDALVMSGVNSGNHSVSPEGNLGNDSNNHEGDVIDDVSVESFYYVSWIYDSPFLDVYSYTVTNPVNRIFHFDGAVVQEFVDGGISTVFHLPLGYGSFESNIGGTTLDTECCDKKINIANGEICEVLEEGSFVENGRISYISDISFVGSLYSEPKHRLYDKFSGMAAYEKGYLDALIEAQKHVYGDNFLCRMLTDNVLAEMEKCYPTDPNPTTAMTPAQMYAEFVLSRQVTAIERREILSMLGKLDGIEMQDSLYNDKHRIIRNLYTNDKSIRFEGWNNKGPVDYYKEMPSIFASSKINLNITLRSIKTGIPLRALDIMGAGGFLLTNYQAELLEYFVPGEDFDYYTDYEDLKKKVAFYLENDEIRERIARNGCQKVREEHRMKQRLCLMLEVLFPAP